MQSLRETCSSAASMNSRIESTPHYYRARYYDPNAGRFLSEDQTQFDGGDPNFYRYVGNSPPNLIDPFGENASNPPITLPWPRTLPNPIALPIPEIVGGIVGIILGELALPASTSSTDILRKDPLDCNKRDGCKKQFAADLLWCEFTYEHDLVLLEECYALADENLARCLDGQPRTDPDPRNKPAPSKPNVPKKPEPPLPFPKPRRPRQ
jgi:RHS repeat-associated protein